MVNCCRATVQNWLQKADSQTTDGVHTDHIAVDETAIQPKDDRYWLYAAVDLATNRLPHVWLFPTRIQAFALMWDLIMETLPQGVVVIARNETTTDELTVYPQLDKRDCNSH